MMLVAVHIGSTLLAISGFNPFSMRSKYADSDIEIEKSNDSDEFANIQEIYLLWKWVEVDDDLDTLIGSSIDELNNKYHLTISFDYEKQNNHCIIN